MVGILFTKQQLKFLGTAKNFILFSVIHFFLEKCLRKTIWFCMSQTQNLYKLNGHFLINELFSKLL